MTHDEILDLLSFVAKYECEHSIYWTEDLGFFVGCNDLFAWATADAEEISSSDDLANFKQAVLDAIEACPLHGSTFGGDLYCARRRGMRPQNAVYRPEYFLGKQPELVPLFNACGPERSDVECG